ncbi:hypothetical protein BC827DRAFT_1235638 [Russula dissimulans]|nr:hypothetical protein BC827DRAFT_1235638 [Russula dissimulans]
MCSPSQLSSFQSLFDSALQDYQKRTKLRLLDHPLAKELEKCDSVDSITAVLQRKARDINQYRGDDGRIMKSVKCTVQVLCTLSTSTVLGECIGLPLPAARAIFAGIGILLGAVKSVTESYDELLDLLGSFENFLCRLEIYTRIPPNEAAALGDILVKIMAELLFTLALATKQIKQGRLSEFVPVDVGQD